MDVRLLRCFAVPAAQQHDQQHVLVDEADPNHMIFVKEPWGGQGVSSQPPPLILYEKQGKGHGSGAPSSCRRIVLKI